MESRVLVAYATQHGATAEIAERIGEMLRRVGLAAEVLPVERVQELAAYDAIVLGSAVYAGQWRKEAAAFLTVNEDLLARRPVWLFSSGPTGQGDAVSLMKGWRFPDAQKATIERIQPRDIVLFHGVLDMKKLNLAEKLLIKGIGAPVGDFRDWQAISAWADGIAQSLKAEPMPQVAMA